MSETAPAVALLFDDTELGEQLRKALHERGARIVHEGGVASLSRELLDRVGAEVLVVNLDDSADDALDQLYEVIDTDHPRVVFNDAQASRTLTGWDRARWARHLAVKVMEVGDVDPPRPQDARGVETVPSEPVPVVPVVPEAAQSPAQAEVFDAAEPSPSSDVPGPAAAVEDSPAFADDSIDFHAQREQDRPHADAASAESENLAAELEALLASGDLPTDGDDTGGGLRFANGEEPPPLHDGNFSMPPEPVSPEAMAAGLDEMLAASSRQQEPLPSAAKATAFQLDHLQLESMVDDVTATIPAGAGEPRSAGAVAPVVRVPDSWALLDDTSLPASLAAETAGKPDPASFGIEKLSATEFLAQDVPQADPGIEPVMSLQLMSMEEAVAPQAYQPVNEMVLDDTGTGLSRLILLGAAVSGAESVAAFLAALPSGLRLTFLLVQHAGGQSGQAMVDQLVARNHPLPVRLAEHGARARVGEVLVVPSGQQARVRRDGSIELQADPADITVSPSIDASFTMAANVFARDALAIVFAGRSTDGVGGAQAVHDRGGKVWVESSSGEHYADMVSGIFAERLVSFSGTPHELAAHLVEVLS